MKTDNRLFRCGLRSPPARARSVVPLGTGACWSCQRLRDLQDARAGATAPALHAPQAVPPSGLRLTGKAPGAPRNKPGKTELSPGPCNFPSLRQQKFLPFLDGNRIRG